MAARYGRRAENEPGKILQSLPRIVILRKNREAGKCIS